MSKFLVATLALVRFEFLVHSSDVRDQGLFGAVVLEAKGTLKRFEVNHVHVVGQCRFPTKCLPTNLALEWLELVMDGTDVSFQIAPLRESLVTKFTLVGSELLVNGVHVFLQRRLLRKGRLAQVTSMRSQSFMNGVNVIFQIFCVT